MEGKELKFIKQKWCGRAAGSDVSKLVARILQLEQENQELRVSGVDKPTEQTESSGGYGCDGGDCQCPTDDPKPPCGFDEETL
jgi:hypothetical protein